MSTRRRIASSTFTGIGVVALLVSMLTIITAGAPSASAGPPAAMFGYVPLPSDDLVTAFKAINSAAGTTLDFTVGITTASTGGVVYYDHWEDGYEADISNPVQATTQVWGDGDPLNGDASVECTTSAGDLLTAGDVFVLRNDITTPRNPAQIRWDGRDKVASTRGFSMTAGGWTTSILSVLAGVVSAFDTSRYGTSYVVPVGQDTPFPAGASPPFEYTGATIGAANDNTLVQVDADNNGSFELSDTIDAGEAYFVNGGLNEGARIVASKPVQVHLMAGDVGATYEGHFFTLVPTALLANTYVNPVGSSVANQETIIYLYNPNPGAITITPTCPSCSGTINVPAEASVSFTTPLGQAVRFTSGGPTFTAVGAAGAQSGAGGGTDNSSVYDWGFTLVPANILTTQVVLGWAPGASDLPPSNATFDPVWVTTFSATTLSVDFDADPTTGALSGDCIGQHDLEIPVAAMVSTRITDPNDNSMTGARVYTCDGTAVAAAWGEDPSTAPQQSPGLDAGYTVIPTATMLVNKTSTLAVDANGDGRFSPGDTIQYELMASNAGGVQLTNVNIADTLMPGLTYIPASTVLDDGTTITPAADELAPPAATVFPLDEGGLSAPPDIPPGETLFVRFHALIKNPWPLSSLLIPNTVDVTTDQGSGTSTDLQGLVVSDLSLTKTQTASPQFVGQNAVFHVVVANGGPDTATGVQVKDLLPAGVTYQSHVASAGSYVPGTGLWTVGTLTNGQSRTLDITARMDVTSVTNYAEVTLAQAADPDSQPAEDLLGPGNGPNQDDEGSATVTVAPRADLSLNKVRLTGPDIAGTTTYRITVANAGPSTATGVAVSELAPPGAVYVGSAPSQGTFDGLASVWTVGSIANGANATLDITYTIDPLSFPATNFAEVTAVNEADPDSQPAEGPLDGANPPNQDDESSVTITLSADLSLTKTETAGPSFVGDNAVFDIVVSNAGPDPANSVQVADLLPLGLVHVSNVASSGAYVPGTGVWSIPAIASGGSETLTITARVTAPGTIVNTAEVSASGAPDPDSTPNNHDPLEDDQASDSVTTTGGSIGDTVYFDINGDGTQDPADQGIAGVHVHVISAGPNGTFGDGDDITLATIITDASGNWSSTGLAPGPYRVNIDAATLPVGLDDPTADLDGIGTPNTTDLTLGSGQDRTDVDFGYTGTASVGDTLFLDFNGNGMPDAGEGIAGVDVAITWFGFDGLFGTSDDVTYHATSDADGVWVIAGMPAGTVQVAVDLSTLPAGITNYVDPDGGNDGISQVTIGAGVTDLNQDFGFIGAANLGHLVWRDGNDNGTFEAGEALSGIGVDVTWFGPDGAPGGGDDHTYSTATDGNGDYAVGNLPAGTFRVTVVAATLPTGSTNTVDPDGGNDSTSQITLAIGGSDLNQNFAYLVPVQAVTASLPVTGGTMLGQLVLGGSGLTFVGLGFMLGASPAFWRRLKFLHLPR